MENELTGDHSEKIAELKVVDLDENNEPLPNQSEVTAQEKFDVLIKELKILSDSLGIDVLLAVNFTAEKQIATAFVGNQDNKIVEFGLAKAIEKTIG